MNRFSFLVAAVFSLLTVVSAHAQNIVRQDATAEDYISLLNKANYHVYAFDISSFDYNQYGFTPVIMKYENGKVENILQQLTDYGFAFTNDVPRLNVGVTPLNDSTTTCHLFLGKCGTTRTLSFKKVGNDYVFLAKPFVLPSELKLNEFIPLMAVSSGWKDEDGVVRNCDVDEFDSNFLDTKTFKKSPLIYVVGVRVKKM